MIAILLLTLLCYTIIIYVTRPLPYFLVNLNSLHQNIVFTSNDIYFVNGVAYDFYSIGELDSRSKPGLQWKKFPLPNEHIPANIIPWTPHGHKRTEKVSINFSNHSETSTTGLAFVDHIYIAGSRNLTDRRANIKRMMTQHQINDYEWRTKWSPDNCYASENREEIYRKINLKKKYSLDLKKQRRCAITMEHIDIWHDIVKRNSSLSLILEDDAVFVPHFREKFDRTIYTAIRTSALKIQGSTSCTDEKIGLHENTKEWFKQDPVIFIGGCSSKYDSAFTKHLRDAQPILTTHKAYPSRCSHAYLLTVCSAKALLRQIAARRNPFLQADFLLHFLIDTSPTLQSFWLDPPIAYQGNHITDLDGIPSFHRTVY
ncbi:unnamed protein product [Rotaria socialis]|uniref:Glycosyl transferase family 25 domain-containing protein n=1 Tax=Rotaria socialis TaxID=392032 RepID=A0A820EIN5_9BILA|nr:unnamed protein product [Rotaria socialis]CAF3404113.1 unnamed protein product [Rotaria socialis]CAF4247711.1 unnamed protein product [Rotaria socialis]CAF4447213.1 unnamed protein product [Rotaria socialis]